MTPEQRATLGKVGKLRSEIEQEQRLKREKDIQKEIAQYLRFHDIYYGQARMDKKTTNILGWPDFTFCFDGVPIALEVKCPGGVQSEDQKEAERRMTANGWSYYLVHSLEDVKHIITSLKKLGYGQNEITKAGIARSSVGPDNSVGSETPGNASPALGDSRSMPPVDSKAEASGGCDA